MYIPARCWLSPLDYTHVSSPQACRYLLVERTNVTLEFCYFKAEGSLNISSWMASFSDYMSGATEVNILEGLHILGHGATSWNQKSSFQLQWKAKRSYLSLERQRAKQLSDLFPTRNHTATYKDMSLGAQWFKRVTVRHCFPLWCPFSRIKASFFFLVIPTFLLYPPLHLPQFSQL